MVVGSQHVSNLGTPVLVVALARNSENEGVEVVYTSGSGLYWALPQVDFEQGPIVWDVPPPAFTVPLGRHQHFKGETYAVVCRARDPKTLGNRIVYQAVDGRMWVRPEPMFGEDVQWPDGVTRPRFVFDPEGDPEV